IRYITGDLLSATGPGGVTTTTLASNANYAAPGAITSNNFQTTLGYSAFLGLTSAGGQNGETATTGYDSAARPSQTKSVHGAVTNYVYSFSPPSRTATTTVEAVINNIKTTTSRWVKTTLDGLGR